MNTTISTLLIAAGTVMVSVDAAADVTIQKAFNADDNVWELRVTNNSPLFNVYGFAIAEDLAQTADGETDTHGWWDAGVITKSNWNLGVSGLTAFANPYLTLPTFDEAFGNGFDRAVLYFMSAEENPDAPYPIFEVPFEDTLPSDEPESALFIAPGATAEVFSFTAINAGSPYAVLMGNGTDMWEATYGETVGMADSDEDGVADDQDNCVVVANPSQLDSDADGIGNVCDQDIAPLPNDCVVNVIDLGALRVAFFATPASSNWNPAADFNGDGVINVIDLGAMRAAFFSSPGPSGVPNACDPAAR